MSEETNRSSSEITSSSYYKQAKDAVDRGDFEYAKQICRDAVDQFERVGADRNASKVYHLLGEIAYQQEDLQNAESWYRKALAIDERIGDDRQLGYAATCNNWLYRRIRG